MSTEQEYEDAMATMEAGKAAWMAMPIP